MKTTTGKPILGGTLGALAALVFILILTFGAILPPTRLVVWTLLGLGVFVGALMLTVAIKSVKFVAVAVVSTVMVTWGLLGLSAHNSYGDLTGGCYLEGISTSESGVPLDAAEPGETSVREPFEIDPYGQIDWEGSTPGGFEGWIGELAVDFGGFNIRVWENTNDNPALDDDEMGVVDIADYAEPIEDATGIRLSGILHLYGSIEAPEGACDMDAYLILPSDSLFGGALKVTLWVILAIIVITLIVLMIPVCRIRKGLGAAAAAASAVTAAGGSTAQADAAAKAVDDAEKSADETVSDAEEAADDAKEAVAKPAAKKPAPKKPAAKKPAAKKPAPKKK